MDALQCLKAITIHDDRVPCVLHSEQNRGTPLLPRCPDTSESTNSTAGFCSYFQNVIVHYSEAKKLRRRAVLYYYPTFYNRALRPREDRVSGILSILACDSGSGSGSGIYYVWKM